MSWKGNNRRLTELRLALTSIPTLGAGTLAQLVPAYIAVSPSQIRTEAGALRTVDRIMALRDHAHRLALDMRHFGSGVWLKKLEAFFEELEKVLAIIKQTGPVVSDHDIEEFCDAAEMAYGWSLSGYGNGPPTWELRCRILTGIDEVLAILENRASWRPIPTDDAVALIIHREFPVEMPGIIEAERILRPLIRRDLGSPASNKQLRRVLGRGEFRARRKQRGRPPENNVSSHN